LIKVKMTIIVHVHIKNVYHYIDLDLDFLCKGYNYASLVNNYSISSELNANCTKIIPDLASMMWAGDNKSDK